MLRKSSLLSILPSILLLAAIGCGTCGPSPKVPANEPPAKDSAGRTVPATSAAEKTTQDDLPGLKELSEADRKLAEKQKRCPVTNELLGTRGMKIYKMTVKDRVIFLCCEGCKDEVDNDPDGTLKKVDELLAKK
jgi:hypothetical protein